MVKALIIQKNNKIQSFTINGHANAGDYNQDLVCAAITGIVSGALNGLEKKFKSNIIIKVEENNIKIDVKQFDDLLSELLEFMIIQLETIEIQYPKNFKIERMI